MGRCYSLATMARMVPFDLLEKFLRSEAKSKLKLVGPKLKKTDIQPIVAAVAALTQNVRDRVEQKLQGIFDLSCQRGMEAILEAAEVLEDTKFLADWPSGSYYAKAMWCYLHRNKIYNKARGFFALSTAKWSRQRDDLPEIQFLRTHNSVLKAFGSSISTFLNDNEGRGMKCTVEHVKRGDMDYFLVHADNYPEEYHSHDARSRLIPRTIRGTFLVIYAVNIKRHTLQLEAPLTKKHREELETIFGREVLGYPLRAFAKPIFQLERLKEKDFQFVSDPADGVTVKLVGLRLQSRANQVEAITIDADPNQPHGRIYEVMSENLTTDLSAMRVVKAKLQFTFDVLEARPAGQTTFEITERTTTFQPHKHDAERVDIIERCLERSGIKNHEQTKRSVETMGHSQPVSDVGG